MTSFALLCKDTRFGPVQKPDSQKKLLERLKRMLIGICGADKSLFTDLMTRTVLYQSCYFEMLEACSP